MQIKVTNINTLESKIVNVKHGTFEETLHQASIDFNDERLDSKDDLVWNGDICKLVLEDCTYFLDIIYHGIPQSQMKQTRKSRDWTEEKQKLMSVYKENMTAKQLSVKSGINLGHVYYLARIFNIKFKPGQRGRRK